MAELRDRKGSENGFKRGTEGSEMRWAEYPGKGHLVGRLVRTRDWIGSWIGKETARNYLETVGSNELDERSQGKRTEKLRLKQGKLQRKG